MFGGTRRSKFIKIIRREIEPELSAQSANSFPAKIPGTFQTTFKAVKFLR